MKRGEGRGGGRNLDRRKYSRHSRGESVVLIELTRITPEKRGINYPLRRHVRLRSDLYLASFFSFFISPSWGFFVREQSYFFFFFFFSSFLYHPPSISSRILYSLSNAGNENVFLRQSLQMCFKLRSTKIGCLPTTRSGCKREKTREREKESFSLLSLHSAVFPNFTVCCCENSFSGYVHCLIAYIQWDSGIFYCV